MLDHETSFEHRERSRQKRLRIKASH